MKIRVAVLTAVGLALAAAGPSAAADKAAGAKGKHVNKPSVTVEGKVQSTDKKKNVLTLKAAGGESLTIKLDRDSKVMRGSKDTLDITNLKPGKKVRVRYDDRNGTNVARWILILPDQGDKKGAAKGKKAAEKTEE